jgi:antitoxin component YwqK of YwqJK toxin-antitoxin module
MNLKVILLCILSLLTTLTLSQEEKAANQTDKSGRKQGRWIKRYPGGTIMYDGIFRDDKPVGEFKRYYEDQTLKSLLIFNDSGTEALAILYYQNGNVASKGKYINQLKEGKWQFFSVSNKNVLIGDEDYLNDKRNGLSRRFYPDSTIAEVISFRNDVKNGEWVNYHPGGSVNFRTNYSNGKLNGKFEAFFSDGKPEVLGHYKNGLRDGEWLIYNENGSQRFKIEYSGGIAKNKDFDIYQSDYVDSLEKNMVKIPDPEKTGKIW